MMTAVLVGPGIYGCSILSSKYVASSPFLPRRPEGTHISSEYKNSNSRIQFCNHRSAKHQPAEKIQKPKSIHICKGNLRSITFSTKGRRSSSGYLVVEGKNDSDREELQAMITCPCPIADFITIISMLIVLITFQTIIQLDLQFRKTKNTYIRRLGAGLKHIPTIFPVHVRLQGSKAGRGNQRKIHSN